MAEPTVFPGDVQIKGTLMPTTLSIPAGSLTNAGVASSAAIDASKLLHMVHVSTELFGPTTSVAALTKLAYVGKGVGTLSVVRAAVVTPANDVSRTVTVDLQKSTGGGAFATVLSGTVGFTNGSSALTLVSGTISSATYAAGDLFRWVVTVAGGSGTQALGLLADFTTYEATT